MQAARNKEHRSARIMQGAVKSMNTDHSCSIRNGSFLVKVVTSHGAGGRRATLVVN